MVVLFERDDRGGFRTPSYPTVEDWQRDPGTQRAFEGVSFVRGDGVSIVIGEKRDRVGAGFVDSAFFPLLRLRPALGRVLSSEDQRDGAAPAVVLAYSLWQQRFGGDPGFSAAGSTSTACRPRSLVCFPPVHSIPDLPRSGDRCRNIGIRKYLLGEASTSIAGPSLVFDRESIRARGGDDGDDRCAAGVGVSE